MSARIPNRDKPTWISYVQATCFGWVIYGFGPAVQLLRSEWHLSATTASLHSLSLAAGSICAGLIGARLMHVISRGVLLHSASFVLLVATVLFVCAPSTAFTLLAAALFGLAGSTIVQSTAAFLNQHQGLAAPAAISELHALTAGIGLFSPILIGLSVSLGWGWRGALTVVIAALAVLEVIRGKVVSGYGTTTSTKTQSPDAQVVHSALPWLYWSCLIVMVCTASTEFSMLFWASDLLVQQGHLQTGASAAALGCVVGGMFIGRWSGAQLARRFDPESIYFGSLVLSLVGFLIFWQSHEPVFMLTGLGLTGLGMSVHFPLGIARAMQASGGQPDRAAGVISIGAGLASGLAPFALGALADHTSTHTAYGIVPSVLVIGLVFTRFNRVPLHSDN